MLQIPTNPVNKYSNDNLEESNDNNHFASNLSQIENNLPITNVEDEEEYLDLAFKQMDESQNLKLALLKENDKDKINDTISEVDEQNASN